MRAIVIGDDRFARAVIKQFADHDKQQGEAIDRSIRTGEPLFATRQVVDSDESWEASAALLRNQ